MRQTSFDKRTGFTIFAERPNSSLRLSLMTLKMPSIEVCFSPQLFPLFKNEEAIVVVVDVLRATSAMCTALQYGAEKIIPVATVEEAMSYRSKGYLVGAERNGQTVEGFDIGNSPYSYMEPQIKGRSIAITTTNGTQAIKAAESNGSVTIGAFVNISSLSKWLMEQQQSVIVLCAGWKNKFNLEDSLFAGALAQRLIDARIFETTCDSALASMRLYKEAKSNIYEYLADSSHRNRLSKLELEKDIRYCLTLDQCDVIPVFKNGAIIKHSI